MINQFIPKIIDEISKIDTENELMNLKSKYLGKKGEFTIFSNSIKDLSIEEKKIQELKNLLERENIKHDNKFELLVYNSPYKILNRRNEITVNIIYP